MAENSALVEVDPTHWLDALLDRVPLRPRDLAPPPPGSGLRPVPGDRGIPFVGLGIHTVRYGPAFQIQLFRRHGPVSWWQAFGRRIVAVAGPEAVQAVLANKAIITGWPEVIGPWFDGGLLAMSGSEHRTDRRVIRTAYADDALAGYARQMAEDADAALAKWPSGRRFLAVPAIRELSGQISTRAFLGLPYHPAGHRIMRLVENCIRAETALLRLPIPGTPWHRAHRSRRQLIAFLLRALSTTRKGTDFLSVLSRLPGLSARRLAEHMLFTLIAAHDTTTAAIIATVYFLGKHPEWQARARTEPDLLEPVIKESIRLVSPSPILMRVTAHDTDILGHYLPAGQLVCVCTGVNQLLPELWPHPERFDPQRFTGDRIHPLAWAPFGAGPHKCIGMHLGLLKVKATLAAMLRRFEWTFPAAYEAPWRFTSLPAPADGLPILLHPARAQAAAA